MNFEEILDGIKQHTEENPTHGVGCACLDKYAGELRRILREKGFYNYESDESIRRQFNLDDPSFKALQNFKVVLSYIIR